MKKSKFLKKSLAMLLALMLVVAMIPLSASAAEPVLTEVDVEANGQRVRLNLGEGSNTYVGSIPNTAQGFNLYMLVNPGNRVYFTDQTSSSTGDATDDSSTPAVEDQTNNVWKIAIESGDMDEYLQEDGTYRVEFSVADEDHPATRLSFAVVLSTYTVSSNIAIDKFTVDRVDTDGNKIPQLGGTVFTDDTIEVTVPYDAAAGTATFKVREFAMVDKNAEAFIDVDANNQVDGTDTKLTVGEEVADGDKIIVRNNNNFKTYTLKITAASGFTSFTTKEGLDAVMFPAEGKIVVLLPYGYNKSSTTTVDVTPVFDLDYESAYVTWGTSTLTSGETAIQVPVADITDGEGTNGGNALLVDRTFISYLDKTDDESWISHKNALADKKNAGWSDFITASIYGVEANGDANDEGQKLTIHYTEKTSRTYSVYFVETQKNNEAKITDLTIGSETAVIDEEAKTIDITLPAGTDVSNLVNSNSLTKMTVTASNNADITVPMQSTFTITEADASDNRGVTEAYSTSGTLNATSPVSIRVVAQDGVETANYTLNVTVSDEYVDPEITDMALKSPDGKVNVTGNLKTIDSKQVYVFDVPYEIYDRSELSNWRLFYTKTVGATAMYDPDNDDSTDDSVAMPKSGASLGTVNDAVSGTNVPYIPTVDDKTNGYAIRLRVAGDELSARGTTYYIRINRVPAKTTVELSQFDVVGTEDPAQVTQSKTYKGELNHNASGNQGSIEALIPWAVYQRWDTEPFGVIANVKDQADGKSSNAKIYYVSYMGGLIPLNNTETPYVGNSADTVSNGTTNLYNAVFADTTQDWRLLKDSTIIVLSEQAWVNVNQKLEVANHLRSDGVISANDWAAFKDDSNIGNWKEYKMNVTKDDPYTGNELLDNEIRLVDGTGRTQTLKVVTDGSDTTNLVGSIPYALTSDINDKETWNPVYLDFNISDRAFLMGVDVGLTSNNAKPNVEDGTDVPVAGEYKTYTVANNTVELWNGVFEDMADYYEMYDNNADLALMKYTESGNPYLIIDRDGTVYVCNGDYRTAARFTDIQNDALQQDKLAVSAEAGVPFKQYTLNLTPKAANTESDLLSFSFAEYPSRRGVIDEATDTVTVTLPYNSEYTYLTPVFSVSDGAIITVDDPELQGKPLYSGYTEVNFTTSRKITVIAENELKSKEYTVVVKISDQFSDVTSSDWFYTNVMDSAANGYVSGYPDGTFKPYGETTRAQFASMIAKALGYEATGKETSAFKDVADDHWAMGAIAYCVDNGVISGYTDGTFRPDKTITRQEAASILKNAFNLTGNSGALFNDDADIADWARNNVYSVKHAGLMSGDANTGNFRPNDNITRAEAASIMMSANRTGMID